MTHALFLQLESPGWNSWACTQRCLVWFCLGVGYANQMAKRFGWVHFHCLSGFQLLASPPVSVPVFWSGHRCEQRFDVARDQQQSTGQGSTDFSSCVKFSCVKSWNNWGFYLISPSLSPNLSSWQQDLILLPALGGGGGWLEPGTWQRGHLVTCSESPLGPYGQLLLECPSCLWSQGVLWMRQKWGTPPWGRKGGFWLSLNSETCTSLACPTVLIWDHQRPYKWNGNRNENRNWEWNGME